MVKASRWSTAELNTRVRSTLNGPWTLCADFVEALTPARPGGELAARAYWVHDLGENSLLGPTCASAKSRATAQFVEICAIQAQQQSPSVENAKKKKVHMHAYTS